MYSEIPDIIPFTSPFKSELLTQAELDALKRGTLRLLDVIRDVGPRGHFLAQKHTRTHIRDFRLSRLLRQKGPGGRPRDPRDVALEEFKRIDETHHPRPLPRGVLVELDWILAAAEREAESIV